MRAKQSQPDPGRNVNFEDFFNAIKTFPSLINDLSTYYIWQLHLSMYRIVDLKISVPQNDHPADS